MDYLGKTGDSQPYKDSDFFEFHSQGFKDPVWEQILKECEKAQEAIDSQSEPSFYNIQEIIEVLNGYLDDSNYLGSFVTVSGKVRSAMCDDEDERFYGAPDDIAKLPVYEDERGRYRMVVGAELVCALFDSRDCQDLDGDQLDGPRVGLTFLSEGDVEIGDDWAPDSGNMFMYPDEIYEVKFQNDSPEAAEAWLKYHFPDIYRHMYVTLPSDSINLRSVVSGLRGINIYEGDEEVMDKVAVVIYSRLGLDDYLYEATVDGVVKTFDEEGNMVVSDYSGKIRQAEIIGCVMEESDDDCAVYRPSIIMSVPQEWHGGRFEIRVVPAESLRGLNSLRSRHRDFGGATLMAFDDPREALGLFKKVCTPNGGLHRDELNSPAEILSVLDEVPISYDEGGFYTLNIKDDLDLMRESFVDHIVALSEAGTIRQDDWSIILELVQKDMIRLQDICIGDTLQTSGDCTVVDPGDSRLASVSSGEVVRGEFSGLVITGLVNAASKETDYVNMELGVVLSNAYLVDTAGEQKRFFTGDTCVVPLLPDIAMSKLFYTPK